MFPFEFKYGGDIFVATNKKLTTNRKAEKWKTGRMMNEKKKTI